MENLSYMMIDKNEIRLFNSVNRIKLILIH